MDLHYPIYTIVTSQNNIFNLMYPIYDTGALPVSMKFYLILTMVKHEKQTVVNTFSNDWNRTAMHIV